MKIQQTELGNIIKPAKTNKAGEGEFPILSMTMHSGLVDQAEKFKKRVASKDTSQYKIVEKGQLVVGFPIDEGVLSFQELYDRAIVSPAYNVWDIIKSTNILPNYLERYLRSPFALSYYASKLQNTTARRRTLPKDVFLSLPVPLPSLNEQKRIASIIKKAEEVRNKRQEAMKLADKFLRSSFFDMFGDPVINQKGWRVKPLKKSLLDARNGLSRRAKKGDGHKDLVMRLQDIHADKMVFDTPNRITLSEAEKDRYLLSKGDIAFIRVNGNKEYVGRSAVFNGYNEPVYFNDHIIRLKFSTDFLPDFLTFIFNIPSGKRLISTHLKTSAGQHTIAQSGIENIEMIIPDKDLQIKFVNLKKRLEDHLNKQCLNSENADHMLKSIIQRAFKGEL